MSAVTSEPSHFVMLPLPHTHVQGINADFAE